MMDFSVFVVISMYNNKEFQNMLINDAFIEYLIGAFEISI